MADASAQDSVNTAVPGVLGNGIASRTLARPVTEARVRSKPLTPPSPASGGGLGRGLRHGAVAAQVGHQA